MNIIIFIIFYTLYIFLCCLFNNKILIFLQKISELNVLNPLSKKLA